MRFVRWFALLIAGLPSLLPAQDLQEGVDVRVMTVTARRFDTPLMKHRLFPAEYELHEGNAATILLRLPWDEQAFMNQVVPTLSEILKIPFASVDRIRAAGPGLPANLYDDMRRAAYRRTAHWEYLLDERPQSEIPLPDLGGTRDFARALAIRIRFQIVNGDLDAAREGILVGLATARHIARTPFLIHQMVANLEANWMLDRLPELLQQSECPNLYWALTAVPRPFLNIRQAADFERVQIQRSVEGADDLERSRTAREWEAFAERILRFTAELEAKSKTPPDEIAAKRRLMIAWGRNELPKLAPSLAARVPGMSDAEITVRWYMAHSLELADRNIAALNLSSPETTERLRATAAEALRFEEQWGLPLPVLGAGALGIHINGSRFGRRVAAFCVVEAARDYAAAHDGTVPERLDQLTEAPAPRDPFTELPFGYERGKDGKSFRLTAPTTSGQTQNDRNFGIDWQVTVRRE